jgi:hypothetical protein
VGGWVGGYIDRWKDEQACVVTRTFTVVGVSLMVRLFIQNGETTYVVEMTGHTAGACPQEANWTAKLGEDVGDKQRLKLCTILLLLLKEIAQEPKTDEASILLARILQVWRSIGRFVRSLVD